MRKTVVLTVGIATLVVGALFTAIPAAASTSFGPYAGVSFDSGTCGNVPGWANDTDQRTFIVGTPTAGGTPVTESFTNGRFTTLAGSSPGACEAGPNNGGTVIAGVKGSFTGSESGMVTCAGTCVVNLNPDVTACAPNPTNSTACFITAIFGNTASFPGGPTFKFTYIADCGQSLVLRQWQNADAASGGNVGDIESALGGVASGARTNPCPAPPNPPTTGVESGPSGPNPLGLVLAALGVLAIAGAFRVRARVR